MTTPVLSPTVTATIADPTSTTPQQKDSNHPDDIKILVPKDFGFIPIPRHLRYDDTKPFHFGLLLNIAFGFASTFSESFPFFCPFHCLNLVL